MSSNQSHLVKAKMKQEKYRLINQRIALPLNYTITKSLACGIKISKNKLINRSMKKSSNQSLDQQTVLSMNQ